MGVATLILFPGKSTSPEKNLHFRNHVATPTIFAIFGRVLKDKDKDPLFASLHLGLLDDRPSVVAVRPVSLRFFVFKRLRA